MAVTRTIYLPTDEDLKLYNRAKKVATKNKYSVSNYILIALRKHMQNPHTESDHVPYILYVGETGSMEKKVFHGLLLGAEVKKEENVEKEVQIYLTKKENIIVYTQKRNKGIGHESSYFEVFSNLEEVSDISEVLYRQVKEKLDIKESELLDV